MAKSASVLRWEEMHFLACMEQTGVGGYRIWRCNRILGWDNLQVPCQGQDLIPRDPMSRAQQWPAHCGPVVAWCQPHGGGGGEGGKGGGSP